jgi:PhzF family phenazine biosynthesis protein
MRNVPCFHVDAFADRAFAGNPAVVCLLDRDRPAKWMQAVAAEMNLSETAFVRPIANGFSLRWFTPKAEVDLCGHATLASAHVLWTEGIVRKGRDVRFKTRSGVLTATTAGTAIELDFPLRIARPCERPAGIGRALGASSGSIRAVARNQDDLLVELASERAVKALRPDFALLAMLPVRGVAVTARSSSRSSGRKFDFVSRFFAPRVGINEDPVTGSAHCALAPWWQERLGKDTMRGFQASARGGTVEVQVVGDRVKLRGSAVTVTRGQLLAT